MANFFKNKAKVILLIYLILIAAFIIYGLAFMTMYSNIHVIYKVSEAGEISFPTAMNVQMKSTKASNYFTNLYFNNSNNLPDGLIKGSFVANYAQTVYDYNIALNNYNDYLIVVGIVSLIAVAFMYIFSNNSRRIYYKSNVVIGVIAPLVVLVMSLVAMIISFSVMSGFTQNETLYKTVSILYDTKYQSMSASATLRNMPADEFLELASGVNVVGILISMLASIVLIGYSVFVSIFTITKYKKTEKERKEIIERAVAAND